MTYTVSRGTLNSSIPYHNRTACLKYVLGHIRDAHDTDSQYHKVDKCRCSSWDGERCYIDRNWRAPWKNRISSTSRKLRKSLVKPVTWQNISSCSVLSPEIVMYDAFNVILWTSADICVVVHDDLWWKNRTTRYNRFWRAGCSRLEYVDICLVY